MRSGIGDCGVKHVCDETSVRGETCVFLRRWKYVCVCGVGLVCAVCDMCVCVCVVYKTVISSVTQIYIV